MHRIERSLLHLIVGTPQRSRKAMNRSLRLLRPLGHTAGRPLAAAGGVGFARPSALKVAAAGPAPITPRAFPPMAIRLYVAPSAPVRADEKKGDHVAPSMPATSKGDKLNPIIDAQNATTGAVEEVRVV